MWSLDSKPQLQQTLSSQNFLRISCAFLVTIPSKSGAREREKRKRGKKKKKKVERRKKKQETRETSFVFPTLY